MNGLLKWLAVLMFVTEVYRNRYRVLNVVLGNYFLRKWAVASAMRIPGFRSRIMQSVLK
ncbi:hypothetical protein [Heyndrickxia acidiproducens]|uniref:hypothetical protein n=1 Tax=Heyndrickxia acidiproducens TaxID=1121084 RepID=UPI00036ABA0B|nr:hypothetical protein [Heyndrickxia acidiproducens]